MFIRKYGSRSEPVRFSYEGNPMEGRAGDTVAAALLFNGIKVFRKTAVSGRDRGPFCLMGTCFDCLVEINGLANKQACLAPLTDGMVVHMQNGKAKV